MLLADKKFFTLFFFRLWLEYNSRWLHWSNKLVGIARRRLKRVYHRLEVLWCTIYRLLIHELLLGKHLHVLHLLLMHHLLLWCHQRRLSWCLHCAWYLLNGSTYRCNELIGCIDNIQIDSVLRLLLLCRDLLKINGLAAVWGDSGVWVGDWIPETCRWKLCSTIPPSVGLFLVEVVLR